MQHRLICLALSLAAACGDGATPDTTPDAAPPPPPMVLNTSAVTARDQLQLARARFVEPASYSYTTTEQCYCAGPQVVRVSVIDGQVSKVLGSLFSGGTLEPVSDDVRARAKTLPGLIAKFAMSVGDEPRYDSTRFTVALDPTRSFVTRFGSVVDIADGSYEVTISDFVTPADAP